MTTEAETKACPTDGCSIDFALLEFPKPGATSAGVPACLGRHVCGQGCSATNLGAEGKSGTKSQRRALFSKSPFSMSLHSIYKNVVPEHIPSYMYIRSGYMDPQGFWHNGIVASLLCSFA